MLGNGYLQRDTKAFFGLSNRYRYIRSTRITWASTTIPFQLLTGYVVALNESVIHSEAVGLQSRTLGVVWVCERHSALDRHGSEFALCDARVVEGNIVVANWQAGAKARLVGNVDESAIQSDEAHARETDESPTASECTGCFPQS